MTHPNAFDTLCLKPALTQSLRQQGYVEMTMIQQKALPLILEGRDLVGRAKTGSGKTAAFALGILQNVDPARQQEQALVLCPTRELADQVTEEIRKLAKKIPNVRVLSVCGGNPMGPQIGSLERGVHIVVGTPGRVLKHLTKETLWADQMQTLVLDEADRMLDMGFSEDIAKIIAFLPQKRQTLLFSATFPEGISKISSRIQKKPVHVDVTALDVPAEIEQYWISVSRQQRQASLLEVLGHGAGTLNLVFCNTKIDCAKVATFLKDHDIPALAMHGDLEQYERTETLVQFSNQSASVLVATDVAARGLDIGKVDAVFNYELPQQPEVYTHRIGRTGRAGRQGQAFSLVTPREEERLEAIQAQMDAGSLERFELTGASQQKSHLMSPMVTLVVNAGRRHKLRPGDLLGAITARKTVPGDAVGKIDVLESRTYIAIHKDHTDIALQLLNSAPIKGKPYKVRRVSL